MITYIRIHTNLSSKLAPSSAYVHCIPYHIASVIYARDHKIILAFISPEHKAPIAACLPDTVQIIPNSVFNVETMISHPNLFSNPPLSVMDPF